MAVRTVALVACVLLSMGGSQAHKTSEETLTKGSRARRLDGWGEPCHRSWTSPPPPDTQGSWGSGAGGTPVFVSSSSPDSVTSSKWFLAAAIVVGAIVFFIPMACIWCGCICQREPAPDSDTSPQPPASTAPGMETYPHPLASTVQLTATPGAAGNTPALGVPILPLGALPGKHKGLRDSEGDSGSDDDSIQVSRSRAACGACRACQAGAAGDGGSCHDSAAGSDAGGSSSKLPVAGDLIHTCGTSGACPSLGVCVVCLSRPSTVAVLSCGHLCLCERCIRVKTLDSQCPVCRASATAYQRIVTGPTASCVACSSQPASVAVLPCGHLCLCETCGREAGPGTNQCPVCSCRAEHHQKVFIS